MEKIPQRFKSKFHHADHDSVSDTNPIILLINFTVDSDTVLDHRQISSMTLDYPN